MSKFEENMEEIFDIEISKKAEILKEIESIPEDINKDYQYTRDNLYHLINKAQEAIGDVLDLAKESGHPRAYEVAGNFIKHTADMTDKLMDLQKKMKDLEKVNEIKLSPNSVTNNMFFGTTADLQKMLKKGKVD